MYIYALTTCERPETFYANLVKANKNVKSIKSLHSAGKTLKGSARSVIGRYEHEHVSWGYQFWTEEYQSWLQNWSCSIGCKNRNIIDVINPITSQNYTTYRLIEARQWDRAQDTLTNP